VKAYEESIEALSKAIEQNPELGEAYLNLAYAYTNIGKHKDSIPLYMKSIEWLPSGQEKKLAFHLMEEAIRIVKENNSVKIYGELDEDGMSSSNHGEITWFYFKYNEEISVINLPCSAYDLKKLTKRTAKNFTNSEKQTDKGEKDMPYVLPLSSPGNTRDETENAFARSQDQEIKNTASSWNDEGNKHFNNQAYEEAIIAYSKAVEIEPTFGQPKNNLALIYFIRGEYDKAILLYQDSIELLATNQEKAIAWNGLGNVYRRVKDYESARIAYQNASGLDQTNGGVYENTIVDESSKKYKTADFWNELGKLFFKIGAYDKATSAFRKAVQLEPSSGRSYGYLARALTAQGQYKEAVSLYHRSIDLIPNDKEKANAWNRLGDVNRKLNDYDNALKAYQNATALSNDKFSLLSRTRLSLLSNCSAKM
jgi:tetratricopeptide (TPR) repeat protein